MTPPLPGTIQTHWYYERARGQYDSEKNRRDAASRKAFEKANGIEIPYRIAPRRPGDIATCYADPSKAKELLHWTAEKTLEDMCRDSWRWQKNNPNGYRDA